VLGFVVDCIDDGYQNELLLALAEAARANDASLLVFAGGQPEAVMRAASPRDRVYELVNGSVDAVISCSGTLQTGIGRHRFARFFERFDGVPRVSIGVPLEGVPSVVVDNEAGMRSAVSHLIERHGRRNVAFIRGPRSNDEAEERYRGYLAALGQAGLSCDRALSVEGDFLSDSGAFAVRTLLDARSASFDAIAAANDEMALGALRELRRRGLPVPERVSVVGFDDDSSAQHSLPSLTTVRQPIAAQAHAAVALALALVRGEPAEARVALPTELVHRRSCGCPLDQRDFAVQAPRRARRGNEESPLVQKRAELVFEMLEAAPGSLKEPEAEALVDAFIAELRGKEGASFAAAWDELLHRASSSTLDFHSFQAAISALRRGAVPALSELGGLLVKAETLLHEARVLLGNRIHHRESERRLSERRAMHALADVAQSLIVCADLKALLAAVERALPRLGIPNAFIALDTFGAAQQRPEALRLVLSPSVSSEDDAELGVEAPSSLLSRLLAAHGDARVYVIEPLFYAERPLGIAGFELGPSDGAVYEGFRAHISAGLESVTLMEAQRESAALRQHWLQRAATHAGTLERLLESVILAEDSVDAVSVAPCDPSADDARKAVRTALAALAEATHEWSRFVGKEQDTLRAPPGTPPPKGETDAPLAHSTRSSPPTNRVGSTGDSVDSALTSATASHPPPKTR
jgi:DNA-binding LacI/PurR family transcriptional regulator